MFLILLSCGASCTKSTEQVQVNTTTASSGALLNVLFFLLLRAALSELHRGL